MDRPPASTPPTPVQKTSTEEFLPRVRTRPAAGPAPVPARREDAHKVTRAVRGGRLRASQYGRGQATESTMAEGRSTWVVDEIGEGGGGALALEPGDMVAGTRYRVVRWVGDGAMGVVYEGEHVDLGRRAALKVMRLEASNSSHAIQLFRQEARAASQIGSDAIAQAFDFVELPDGRLMFAMEFVPGQSLDKLVEAGPIDPQRLVAIARQAGQALSAAHDAGIIHRDIKPENMMLQEGGERPDRLRILDFGVASISASVELRDTDVVGSPFYMAPEIIAGETYDARVDIYSLGCTAYELLTGNPPFVRETIDEVLRAHMTERPRSLQDAGVPPALDQVILKMLGKSPSERYADMREVVASLLEAQIEIGFTTAWDHLPLPDVDPERRAAIEAGLRDLTHGKRSRWPFFVAGVAVVAALGTAAFFLTREPDTVAVADSVQDRIDDLTVEARAAATKRFYVYPSPDDPGAATAYTGVLQLESMQDERAGARATELRGEFAGELRGFADAFWDREPGSPAASEFYAMVVMFDPDDTLAAERLVYDETELDNIRELARGPTFSVEDLIQVEPLKILTQENEALRTHMLKRYLGREGARKQELEIELEQLIEGSRQDSVEVDSTEAGGDTADETETPAEMDGSGEEGGAGRAKVSVAERAAAKQEAAVRKARTLAETGDAAARFDKAKAKDSYEQAIALDPSNAAAHAGLALLYFERSNFGKAAKHCAKAARLARRDGDNQLLCGDAYFRLGNNDKARVYYGKAANLGVAGAGQRIEKLGD